MRRFWPLLAAILCWIVILSVPVTRNGVSSAWRSYRELPQDASDKVAAGPFTAVSPQTAAILQRFPNDRDVLIYAAKEAATDKDLKTVANLHPTDAYIIRLQLMRAMKDLKDWRVPGPLSNINYPAAPPPTPPPTVQTRARWNEIIALSRRGIQLEPNNTFFDWMLLNALYATNRDGEARQVLSLAARKTAFNSHERDDTLRTLAYLKRAKGSPLSPLDLIMVGNSLSPFGWDARVRQTSRSILETAIADRKKGAHDQALGKAIDLLKLSGVLRREGYTLVDSMVGASCEYMAMLNSLALPAPGSPVIRRLRNTATLAQFRSHPRTLYAYAQATGRKDLLPFLDARWSETGKWNGAIRKYVRSGLTPNSIAKAALIIVTERLRALIVRVLPSILIAGVIFWLLSRRFRDGLTAPGGLWRGVALGAFLLLGAMICDLAFSASRQGSSVNSGLLSNAPSWANWGLAGLMLCFAVHWAVGWQKRQSGVSKTFKSQFKALFAPPEDGLARFDFGWLFGWVARLTFWIILLGGLGWLCTAISPEFQDYIWLVPAILIGFSLMAHASIWRRTPHRRQALKLSLRLSAEAMAGFFVVSSVVYTVAAIAVLPMALQFERENEREVQAGPLKIARGKLGL